MDDLEFRRRCYTNPHDQAEDFLRKQRENPDAGRFAQDMREFGAVLKETMNIAPQRGLADRIILKQTLQAHQHYRKRRWQMVALAASVVLGVGLSLVLWVNLYVQDIDDVVLQHIHDEHYLFAVQHDIQEGDIRPLLLSVGADLRRSLGPVNYAGTCRMRKSSGVHLILPGVKGAVTVLLMPAESIGRVEHIEDGRFQGIIVPSTRGSIAVVGEKGEPLEKILEKVRNSVIWET